MKVITANRLTDGKVVYRTSDGAWSEDPANAQRLDDAAAQEALEAALRDVLTVVGPYPMEVDAQAQAFKPSGRKHLREAIRRAGPTAGSTRPAWGG